MIETISGASPIVPVDTAPANTTLVGNIVIGRHKTGGMALELRLPSGMPFNAEDPAHQFGLFVVQNAQQLLGIALQEFKRAQAVQQTNEIIAAAALPGV
jgi:hypothetical protein